MTPTSATADCYDVHGYTLCLELPGAVRVRLPAPRSAPDDRPRPGLLRVALAEERAVPDAVPGGELLAELPDGDGGRFYSFARDADRLVLRFHGTLDLESDPALTSARAHLSPGTDPGVLSVLLPGTVMAVRLMLDRHLVLHASAVEHDGRAVAFAGPSGGGKSTLAALGVLAGLGMVSDDVLRVDLDGDVPARVWPGASAVRLRPGVGPLARTMGGAVARTVDGRFSVEAPRVAERALPLRCVVLPRLDATLRVPSVVRLPADDALRVLVRAPRVVGWCGDEALARQFFQLADLCERVPVVALGVPSRRRNDPTVVEELVGALDSLA